ncbi:Amino acid transporter AVT1C [Dirofilaria immitis]
MSRLVGDSSATVSAQTDSDGITSSETSRKPIKAFLSDIEMQNNQQDKTKDTTNTASINEHSTRGYSWLVASVIVVADLVGGGLVAMPAGFHDTGMLIGCIFMGLIAIFFMSTAYLLSETWGIMRDRWVVYKTHCRQPYPEIGMRSFGPKMRTFTVFCVNTTLFGVTTVYVILSSSIFHKVLVHFDIKIHFCLLLIILSILILPITFLKSPADFWIVLAISLLCTVIAAVLIFFGISQDYNLCKPSAVYKSPSFYSLYSLGTFVFAYSGHHVFPTIQHDMQEPKEFSKSVLLGFFWACCLYIPLSIYAYAVYGQSMQDSLIDSIQSTWIRQGADLAVAFHCVLTIILTINPINQQVEDMLHVPHKMCWQRVIVRTGLLAVILFVALSIPNFGSIMDFFGSTTIPFTCIILPTLFGLSLKNQRYSEKTKKWKIPTLKEIYERTPSHILIWFLSVNVLTIIASAISAFMAVKAMATIRFIPPCYIQPFLQSTDYSDTSHSLLKCCGQYSNITWNSEIQCSIRMNG